MSNLYRFGQFSLDPRKRTLSRAGSLVPLTPKAFDVLLFLVQNPTRLVTKDELLQAVWGTDTFVEEGNLKQYISHLRKALGDEDARLIVTIARRGYQFTADVTSGDAADSARPSPPQIAPAEESSAYARPAGRPSPASRPLWRSWLGAAALLAAVAAAIFFYW